MPDLRISELPEDTSPSTLDVVEVLVAGENRKVPLLYLPRPFLLVEDGSFQGAATAAASDSTSEASLALYAGGGSAGDATFTASSDDTRAGFVAETAAGTLIEAVNDGSDKIGFFGAAPVVQQSYDSGDTDANRIAALEAIVAALGFAVDTA